MRKIIAGMQMSLDAKIEGPDGHADWVSADGWNDTYGLLSEVDACLLGRGMYEGYEAYWNAVFVDPTRPLELTGKLPTTGEIEYAGFAVSVPHYVLTHRPATARWSKTRFISSFDEVRALRERPGKSIYAVGGAETVSRLLDAGLLDELRVTLHPLVAGKGLALFDMIEHRHLLELISADRRDRGLIDLRYAVSSK